jgi:hypothetical protein
MIAGIAAAFIDPLLVNDGFETLTLIPWQERRDSNPQHPS